MEINKKYNKLIILSFLSIIIILIFIGITGFLTTSKIKVKTISIDETINEDNTKTLEIEIYNPPSFAVDLNLNTTLTQLSTAIFYVKFLYFLVVQLVYNVI